MAKTNYNPTDTEDDEQQQDGPALGTIPSSGYGPLRSVLDPNDPDYLKKLGLVGAMEGQHELNDDKMRSPTTVKPAEGNTANVEKLVANAPDRAQIGPQLYRADKPQVTAAPGTVERPEQELERGAYEKMHPWGAPVSEHPGILGKIGHIAATAGNIAGDILAPKTMELIPGTQLYKERQQAEQQKELQTQQAIRLKPELAEMQGEIKGALETQKDEAAQKRVETQQAGASERATERINAGGAPEFFQGPNGEIVQGYKQGKEFHLIGGEKLPEGYTPYKAPAGIGKPVQGSINNEPKWGLYDPKQGWVDPVTKKPLEGFTPPLSWAEVMPGTHTISLLAPDTGVPTTYQYDPHTKTFSIPAGQSAAGAYGHSEAQAGAVTRASDELINDIQANEKSIDKSKLGDWLTWVKKYGLDTPFADPTLARLQSEYTSFAALNPAMHGYRSVQAMQGFEGLVGGLQKNPEAAIEALRGIQQTAGAINPGLSKTGKSGAPPKGAKIISLDDFLKGK